MIRKKDAFWRDSEKQWALELTWRQMADTVPKDAAFGVVVIVSTSSAAVTRSFTGWQSVSLISHWRLWVIITCVIAWLDSMVSFFSHRRWYCRKHHESDSVAVWYCYRQELRRAYRRRSTVPSTSRGWFSWRSGRSFWFRTQTVSLITCRPLRLCSPSGDSPSLFHLLVCSQPSYLIICVRDSWWCNYACSALTGKASSL